MTKEKTEKELKVDDSKKEIPEEEIILDQITKKHSDLNNWIPKTDTGRLVKEGKITSFEEIVNKNLPVLEPEIVDYLIPDLEILLVDFKKTTMVKMSGRKFSFRAAVLVGDKQGLIGVGLAKDKERFPSIKKATKNAKLNLVKVRRGCGSWECVCGLKHSVPFAVEGKCASVRVKLMPAPRGTGLVVGDRIKDVMRFAGIEDVWSNTKGSTDTKLNFVLAAVDALNNTVKMKVSDEIKSKIIK